MCWFWNNHSLWSAFYFLDLYFKVLNTKYDPAQQSRILESPFDDFVYFFCMHSHPKTSRNSLPHQEQT